MAGARPDIDTILSRVKKREDTAAIYARVRPRLEALDIDHLTKFYGADMPIAVRAAHNAKPSNQFRTIVLDNRVLVVRIAPVNIDPALRYTVISTAR